jgi:putative ABC transport system permease protein
MMSVSNLITVPLLEACLYAPAAYGVFLAFRILRFPDLAVDNTFSLGALVGTAAATSHHSLWFAFAAVALSGAAVGALSSALFTVAHISKLLSTVMVYSMLFSVNLRIFGRPNVPFPAWDHDNALVAVATALISTACLLFLLAITLGKTLVAHGNNPRVTAEFGINAHLVTGTGLALANALIAMSGFVTAQSFGFADVGLGAGALLHAVASIIIGTAIIRGTSFRTRILAIAVGLVAHSALLFAATSYLSDVLRASDVKLLSSVLVVAIVVGLRTRQEELFEL